jgi:hypothetical protein
MGCTSDENHTADFTSGAWFVILLFDLGAIVEDSGFRGWDRAEQCTAERQFLSARTVVHFRSLLKLHSRYRPATGRSLGTKVGQLPDQAAR